VRGLAALSVLAFHVWLYRDDRPHGARSALLDHALFSASAGLIAFFVLSGFLLYRAYAQAAVARTAAPATADYALRRVARIVPAYYVCGIACFVLYSTIGPDHILPKASEMPAFAVFAQNYSLSTLMQLNPVLWTLSVEAAFYVALPLLALAGARLALRGHALLLVGLIGAGVAFNIADKLIDAGEIPAKTLGAYIGVFAIGMLAALLVERRGRPLTASSSALCMLLGIVLVITRAAWTESHVLADPVTRAAVRAPLSAVGFALMIVAAAVGTGAAVGWLRWRPLAYAGLVSYGIYLWHVPVILVLRERGALPTALAPRMATVLAVTVAIAALSWHWIEKPVLARARNRRRRAPVAARQPAVEAA
jgi:acetyltransferase